jgi:hypothetical protein
MTDGQRIAMHAEVDAKWQAIIANAETRAVDPFYIAIGLFPLWRAEKQWVDAGCPILVNLAAPQPESPMAEC